MSETQPDSQEVRKKVAAIRNLFLSIAALNIIFIAIIFLWRDGNDDMEEVAEIALNACHRGDASAFASAFSRQSVDAAKEAFRAMQKHSPILSKKVIKDETNADKHVLGYELLSKGKTSRLTVHFQKEGAALRIVDWRIE
jgi:hypothetical protein